MTTITRPVIILDRDGVINYDSPYYIKSAEEFIPIPGSIEAIARLTRAGYRIGVATNQSGIARGYYTEEQLGLIHQKLLQLVTTAGGKIESIVYCKHMPDTGCTCRKPKPGLLLELAAHFQCNPNQIYFIGDKATDLQAAESIKARSFLILSPMTEKDTLSRYPHVAHFSSLAECTQHLLSIQPQRLLEEEVSPA